MMQEGTVEFGGQRQYLPARPSKLLSVILIGIVIGLYILENSPAMSLIGSRVYLYGVKPCIWLGLTCFIWKLPAVRPKGVLKFRQNLFWWALNFAVIYLAASVLAGMFIDGLGKSPFNNSTVIAVLLNVVSVFPVLVGREFVRSSIVNTLADKENYLVFVLIALLFTLPAISFSKVTSFKEIAPAVKYVAEYVAPEFAGNLLVTYLAFLGGPLPAITYAGILETFFWFSPILPDLQWITDAFVGVLCPVFCLTSLQTVYYSETKVFKSRSLEGENPAAWMFATVFSIGLIWFVVGVFPVYPSVIATGSMEPMICPGDVILVEKITEIEGLEKLRQGDVIQFKEGSVLISHRIIEIVDQEGVACFRTKGDNNPVPDFELVNPENVKGKVIDVVPKIGWPTLLIKKGSGFW